MSTRSTLEYYARHAITIEIERIRVELAKAGATLNDGVAGETTVVHDVGAGLRTAQRLLNDLILVLDAAGKPTR